ncbi:unnamed protein product [Aspergillus oryzae RIB40]|uniref:DNA, SC113 n=1 Tax=Aspergillus oryzae (strain ATCC 42149 / RIB 40) TaxID=510516 RepID=Q2U6K4_ASPOR|nr:unnamed protein product [Aspergillus oryzae RIB40]BAE62811.1 unnamed protein product [Aspergillus oryzae RIB40]
MNLIILLVLLLSGIYCLEGMTFSPYYDDDASQLQPPDPWIQTPSYAPTPGDFGRDRTPSVFCPSPEHVLDEPYTPLHQSQPNHLGFFQEPEERTTRQHRGKPCIHYTIEWKVTLNNRTVSKDTEQDLAVAPSSHWAKITQDAENVMRRKIRHNQRVRSDDTTVRVSVNERGQSDLNKRFDGTNIDWKPIEKQLLMWGNLFHIGKKLKLFISINYIEDSGPPLSRNTDKRGKSSVTRRMLTERDAQIDAEQASGQRPYWREVYQTMRCPGPPCRHEGQYCWLDPVGKKHYKLRTHHLRRLVKYVEGGGILDTHDDIPDDVREQLYAEEALRLEKQKNPKHSASGSICPPININVLPAQSSQSLTDRSVTAEQSSSSPNCIDSVDIPGFLDDAVEEYANWHLSRVGREIYRDHIKKARDVALENGLDLQQVSKEDPDFFVKQGVIIGVARRFVSDIRDWANQYRHD